MSVKNITVRIDEKMLSRLKYIAKYEKRSVNRQIEMIIKRCVHDFEDKNGSIDIEKQ